MPVDHSANLRAAAEFLGSSYDFLDDELLAAAAEIDRLRAGIQAMLDGDYPNPRSHRPGKCPHGQPYYEECGECNDDWLTGILNPAVSATLVSASSSGDEVTICSTESTNLLISDEAVDRTDA